MKMREKTFLSAKEYELIDISFLEMVSFYVIFYGSFSSFIACLDKLYKQRFRK